MFFRLPDWLRYEIQERWERLTAKQLALRKWGNQQDPRIIISVTCASVFVFLVIVIWQLIPEKPPEVERYEKGWYYDLNTGKLFVAKSGLILPVEAPSGPLPNGEPAGVKAYVFTYTYEPSESERFIGFLETTDPNYANENNSKSIKPKTDSAKRWGQGKLIRRVEDEQWIPADSIEGRAILKEIFLPNETGERASYCPPK